MYVDVHLHATILKGLLLKLTCLSSIFPSLFFLFFFFKPEEQLFLLHIFPNELEHKLAFLH